MKSIENKPIVPASTSKQYEYEAFNNP